MRKSKTTQIYRSGSYMYSIKRNETDICIQIQKNSKVEAEERFPIEQLKAKSVYFCLFSSIQSVYDDLIALSSSGKIAIEENKEEYLFALNINLKEISTITLNIPKQIDTSPPKAIIEQFPIKMITARFDTQDSIIHKMNSRLESIESILRHQSELLNQVLLQAQIPSKKNSQSLAINRFNFQIDNDKRKLINHNNVKPLIHPLLLYEEMLIDNIGFLNEEERTMVSNWIFKDKQGICKWKLLYNPKRGEDNYEECLRLSYHKPSIVVLIESTSGCKFGGYTSVGWDTPPDNDSFTFKADPHAFLFSIDKKKKYDIKKDYIESSICCLKDYSFTFYSGLGLCDNFMSSNENRIQLTQYGNDEPKFEINNDDNKFTVKQLFAYQITY